MDFHHNIFYFYRGARADEGARVRQLEDNTTKALINVLENIQFAVAERFLRFVGLSMGQIHDTRFCLQRSELKASPLHLKRELLLLALVPEHRACAQYTVESNKADSRPDAWIYGEEYAVLIESKVAGYLDYQQMRNHYGKLHVNPAVPPACAEYTWAEVQRFFKGELRALTEKNDPASQRDAFLIHQFTDYLDMCSLGEFSGFDKEFFDYFVAPGSDETRGWVKKKIRDFAGLVLNELSGIDKDFYQDFDQGNLGKYETSSWVAFGPGKKKYRKLTHLTLRFNAQGMELFINIETKPATDRVKKIIDTRPDDFRKAVQRLCDLGDLVFVLEKRVQEVASRYDYKKIFEINSQAFMQEETADMVYDVFVKAVDRIPLPSINVIRRFKRSDLVSLSSHDDIQPLVKEVLSAIKDFNSFVSLCNQSCNR